MIENTDTKKLQDERNQLFTDYYNNIIPKRMPISIPMSHSVVAEYGEVDLFELQYNYSLLEKPARDICDEYYTDMCPVNGVGGTTRLAPAYQIKKSQSFVIGSNGFMQHPEVCGMDNEDYDYLIEDPYACIMERVIPKQYKAFTVDNGAKWTIALQKSNLEMQRQSMMTAAFIPKIIEEKGYFNAMPRGAVGFSAAPYDYIADQLRGFTNICRDIRRDKAKVQAACESILPLMFHLGKVSNPDPMGFIGTPLHMPTFMREKDFLDTWFPTYKTLTEQWSARGMRTQAFCEDDWMRYLDILQDMPASTVLKFEYGDAKLVAEKLGNKGLITGLYPISIIKTGTAQQCIDKAKEILDIMMPYGSYMFGFDKSFLSFSDVNLDNIRALAEYLRDNTQNPNAGQPFGQPINAEGFNVDSTIEQVSSKYFTDWKEFKAEFPMVTDNFEKELYKHDISVMNSYLGMLV